MFIHYPIKWSCWTKILTCGYNICYSMDMFQLHISWMHCPQQCILLIGYQRLFYEGSPHLRLFFPVGHLMATFVPLLIKPTHIFVSMWHINWPRGVFLVFVWGTHLNIRDIIAFIPSHLMSTSLVKPDLMKSNFHFRVKIKIRCLLITITFISQLTAYVVIYTEIPYPHTNNSTWF